MTSIRRTSQTLANSILQQPALLVTAGILLTILWLMVLPVRQGFSAADSSLLSVATPLTIVTLLLLWFYQKPFRLSTVDFLVAGCALHFFLRAWFSSDYSCALPVFRVASLLILYIGLRFLFSAVRTPLIFIKTVLLLFTCIECLICMWQIAVGRSHHAHYLFTGSFLNPAPCSVAFIMSITLSLYSFFTTISSKNHVLQRLWKTLLSVSLILSLILLPIGWSRSAIVSGILCFILATWKHTHKRVRFFIVALLLILTPLLYLLKQGSADGRILFYLTSALSFVHHPIWGSGIGSFFHAYSIQIQNLQGQLPDKLLAHADTIEYALSDFSLIGVEQGGVGLLLFLTLLYTILARLSRCSRPLALSFLSVTICSFFSYPLQLLPFQLLFVLLTAFACSQDKSDERTNTPSNRKGFFKATAICICALTCSLLLRNPISKHVQASQMSTLIIGHNNDRFIEYYRQIYPFMQGDTQFLFRYGQLLADRKRWNESNAVLLQGISQSNDAMFYVVLGNNYLQLQAYADAEHCYKTAHALSPARLYPLYKLMLFYEHTDNIKQTTQTAQVLLRMRPKTQSPLTRQILHEASRRVYRQ